MNTKLGWLAILVAIGTSGGTWWWQHHAQVQMRNELGHLRRQNGERARLREANRRLAEAQPAAEELESLRANRAAMPQLRTEIARLQAQSRMAEEQWAARSSERFAAGNKLPARDWKNAGAATSKAALETVLWAAAGGDIDAFASRLMLPNEHSRQVATKLLESLPVATREQYGTPERLIAFLASKDVPLGAAQIISSYQVKGSATSEQVRLQLSAADGRTTDLFLRFANQPDGWKLVVPDAAIAKYLFLLTGTPPSAVSFTSSMAATTITTAK